MPVNQPIEESNDDAETEELAEWLKDTIGKLGDDDPGLIVITARGGEREKSNEVAKIDPTDLETKSIDELAHVVYDTAAHDAMKVGGGVYFITIEGASGRFPLNFQAFAHEPQERGLRRDDDDRPMGRAPFGRVPVEGWVEWTKTQNKHFEVLFDSNIRERTEMNKLMKATVSELTETVRHLEKERAKERVLIEELQSAKHIRDIEVRKIEKSEERKDEALGLLKPWAHGISARLLGPKAIPKDVVPLLQQFEAVFSTFTPEQFTELTTSGKLELTTRQRQEIIGLFSTLMNLTEQAKKAKAEQEAASANGQGQA